MALVELDKLKSIYIAGHQGMVGSALVRKFKKEGFKHTQRRGITIKGEGKIRNRCGVMRQGPF